MLDILLAVVIVGLVLRCVGLTQERNAMRDQGNAWAQLYGKTQARFASLVGERIAGFADVSATDRFMTTAQREYASELARRHTKLIDNVAHSLGTDETKRGGKSNEN